MSYYKKIFSAVEEAVFIHQVSNAEEAAKYVSQALSIKSVNTNEIKKIIERVATQYKVT